MVSGGSQPTSAEELSAVVRVSKANVRKAPDKNSQQLFSLRRNSKVKVLEERDQWFHIVTDTGRRGWLFGSLLRIVKPQKIEPEIDFFSGSLTPDQEVFFAAIVGRLKQRLAAVTLRRFELVVSEIDGPPEAAEEAGKQNSWLLLLKIPFSQSIYQQEKGVDLEVGTVDLLLYQEYLKVMLESRDLLLEEIKKKSQVWLRSGEAASAVRVVLALKSENGDEVCLSGFRERGFPAFNDYMILEIHGFSRFFLRSAIPASVAEFNKFVLPPPQLPDGSRSPAALAYDFFGFAY